MDKLMKKLENMDQGEREQLRQLLSEKKKEEESGKLGWMYNSGKPDTEDYLLGRRIDKYIDDDKEKKEAADKDAPGSIFSEAIAKRSDLDMQAKMREDPLYAIRKKEEEARRRLLENPIKMKQLQKVLEKKADEDKKTKKKKKKKDKKHKKKHKSSDSDSSSDDDELVKKYLALLAQKKQGKHSSSEKCIQNKSHKDSKPSPSSCEEERSRRDQEKISSKLKGRDSSGESSDSSSSNRGETSLSRRKTDTDLFEEIRKHVRHDSDEDEMPKEPKAYGLIVKDGHNRLPTTKRRSTSRSRSPKRFKRSRSPASSQRKSHKRARSPKSHRYRSRSPREEHRSLRTSRSPSRSRAPAYRGSRSPDRRRSRSPRRSPPKKVKGKKKLSAEEMEKKRQEMMDNAKWRDEQRTSNIERYRKEDDTEKELLKKQTGKKAEFVSPILSEHASQSSLEDRLRRNRYSLQRTKVELDKAFTKH